MKILEIGYGSGSFLSKLRSTLNKINIGKKINLTGIDIDENVIRNNLSHELNLICFSVEKFSESNENRYDLILHFELING